MVYRGQAAASVDDSGVGGGGWRQVLYSVASAAAKCSVDDSAAALAAGMAFVLVTRATGFHVSWDSSTELSKAPLALLASGRLLHVSAPVPANDSLVSVEPADVTADLAMVCGTLLTQPAVVLERLMLHQRWAGMISSFEGTAAEATLQRALDTCHLMAQSEVTR